jgi:TetR/AcrR family transcriptional regulator, regulator of mycofactocin system
VSTAGGGDRSSRSLTAQLREQRWETVAAEIESAALRLFRAQGFASVTVEDIAGEVGVSPRTFYRYFPAKEDVLLLRIDRRTRSLHDALGRQSTDETPLSSLRHAVEEVLAAEDEAVVRCWTDVVSNTPSVLRSVIGGIQLKSHELFAGYFADFLGQTVDALVPTMLAAAVGGVIQAGHIHWYVHGGDLASTVSEGLRVLERGFVGDLTSWTSEGLVPDWPRPSR